VPMRVVWTGGRQPSSVAQKLLSKVKQYLEFLSSPREFAAGYCGGIQAVFQ
jgi:hypothetical protein